MARRRDPWGPDIIAVLVIATISARLGHSEMEFLVLVIIVACIVGYIQAKNKKKRR